LCFADADPQETRATALLDHIDPDGLLEYSVVFTDRSLNHMSTAFYGVMTDISGMLKEVYKADAVALIPGGGDLCDGSGRAAVWQRGACPCRTQRMALLPLNPDL
jgi:hypothetical protein